MSRWLAASLALAVLFRLPPLVDAAAINSDAAIVGVEALHFLHGDWALQLWGTSYQTAVESLLVTPLFAIGGPRPVLVFVVPLVGMLVMIALVHRLLREHIPDAAAFACTLPLVFATQAINTPMTFIMRQTMVTCVTAGVLLLSRASQGGPRRFLWAGLVFAAGVVVDTFALELVPAGALFALLCAMDERPERRVSVQRLAHTAAGMALGLALAAACGQLGFFGRKHVVATAAATAVAAPAPPPETVGQHLLGNWRIFSDCAPFALGAKAWYAGSMTEWPMPSALRVLFGLAALVFAGLIASAIPLARSPRVAWPLRRLGVFGAFAGFTAVMAFLITGAPKDVWSVRYLAPLMWFSPLAIAPAVSLVRRRTAVAVVGAWAIGAGVCGWASYGDFVDGLRIRLTARGAAAAEGEVRSRLLERGIHEAYAPYWNAYRLSLLFAEDPLVVPLDPKDDRRAQLRRRVEEAKRVAVVLHPSVPGPDPAAVRTTANVEEELRIEDFTVLIVRQ